MFSISLFIFPDFCCLLQVQERSWRVLMLVLKVLINHWTCILPFNCILIILAAFLLLPPIWRVVCKLVTRAWMLDLQVCELEKREDSLFRHYWGISCSGTYINTSFMLWFSFFLRCKFLNFWCLFTVLGAKETVKMFHQTHGWFTKLNWSKSAEKISQKW